MISSTTRDLPDHRKEVMDACLRQGMFPVMMEHLPANDSEAILASLSLVDKADIYLGVFAHRYGYIPEEDNPQKISITEMEYNRAGQRGIPRLIFIIDEHHALGDFTIIDIDTGESAAKLAQFKRRLETENIVNYFKSPADLRAHIVNSLSKRREPDVETFHHIAVIPPPPNAFIAHPYTLLQTHRLIGRQAELNLLTDWVARKQERIYHARVLSIVALGGLGKSALTWRWFNEIAAQEMSPFAGRMWWSFYESDATFENFVTRALAYVTKSSLKKVQRLPAPEREALLLAILDQEPFLIVLDGLERILIAYARMDAAHLADDDLDRQTANVVADAYGLPESAAQSFTGEHRLRKTADPRAGSFLRKLATVQATRVLSSTRLYPADLQTGTGEPLPQCNAIFLAGLTDDDALELWRAFGGTGARDSLLPLFNRVDNHPLVIQALASEVARYRSAPGDFEQWRHNHPGFDPFSLPLVQVRSHVLEYALRGLADKTRKVLHVIAAFRMPARYDTLAALLIGNEKPCAVDHELDEVLTELEDRGLVGWDKSANRYDLHPIVRGVVWSGLGDEMRQGVYTNLHEHFGALPMITNWMEVSSLEDLTPAIELYNTLIGLRRYNDAAHIFYDRLNFATLHRLSASRQRVELLEMFFPNGLDREPSLNSANDQAFMLNALAQGYELSGQPGRAAPFYRRATSIYSRQGRDDYLLVGLGNLSNGLRLSGALYESEVAARQALKIARIQHNSFQEAIDLIWLGSTLAAYGKVDESKTALGLAVHIFRIQSNEQSLGAVFSLIAQRALWLHDYGLALTSANSAWELAHLHKLERDFIRAARGQGEAFLRLNRFDDAEARLHHALSRARVVNLSDEELPAFVALAELRRRQGNVKAAREYLDEVWDAASRGPYPLIHADAFNVLAQIERDVDDKTAAVEAATQAYSLAWCDGLPFVYHWGLSAAQEHLRALDASEPQMPPFDETKVQPMPEVKIDPKAP